ncbi:hypothetical protein [Hasllibacter sp. MH4015]|uniref:hypothetical protein n=1 Tax=Hasllibacter sp. MH4015 TaxID=2854029 RepID=UPI001CD35AD8|nr:hypothetical protein [Hasllibacter sp. MH4015]
MKIALAAALVAIASPVLAWEAGTDGTLCTLTHAEPGVDVRLTFDPTIPLYTISVAGDGPWPVAPAFAMQFVGPRPNTITTDRHVLGPDRARLTVADRGFGNVLDGLAFNRSALARSGDRIVEMSLDTAAEAVEAFRNCGATPSV